MAGSSYGSADGIGTNAQFYYPNGIAIDTSGNVYVADIYNAVIRKVTSAGLGVLEFIPQFYFFHFIDNLSIFGNCELGSVTTLVGSTGMQAMINGVGSNAQFYYPSDIACPAVAANGAVVLYIPDNGNYLLRKVAVATGAINF